MLPCLMILIQVKFRQRDSLDDVFRVLQQIRKFKVEKDKDRNIVTLSK